MSLLDSLGLYGLSGQNYQQLSQQANQAFNTAYNSYQQGQLGQSGLAAAAQQYNNQLWRTQEPSPWVFNGKPCSVKAFADEVWPEDCKEKTFFLLKHAGE